MIKNKKISNNIRQIDEPIYIYYLLVVSFFLLAQKSHTSRNNNTFCQAESVSPKRKFKILRTGSVWRMEKILKMRNAYIQFALHISICVSIYTMVENIYG